MKKILIIILISFCILGCMTKKSVKNQSKTVDTTEVSEVQKKSEIKHEKATEKEDSTESEVKETEEQKKEVEIRGKVDKENPMTFYNVVDGDTIDLFRITGNADFIFKSSNNSQKSTQNNQSTQSKEKENKSENSVSKVLESVKSTVNEVKEQTVHVVKKDLTFGTYLIWFGWGLAIMAILIFIGWLRKTTFWTSFMTRIFKKR